MRRLMGVARNHRLRSVATSRAGGPNTNSPVNSRYTRLAGSVSGPSVTVSWSIIIDSYVGTYSHSGNRLRSRVSRSHPTLRCTPCSGRGTRSVLLVRDGRATALLRPKAIVCCSCRPRVTRTGPRGVVHGRSRRRHHARGHLGLHCRKPVLLIGSPALLPCQVGERVGYESRPQRQGDGLLAIAQAKDEPLTCPPKVRTSERRVDDEPLLADGAGDEFEGVTSTWSAERRSDQQLAALYPAAGHQQRQRALQHLERMSHASGRVASVVVQHVVKREPDFATLVEHDDWCRSHGERMMQRARGRSAEPPRGPLSGGDERWFLRQDLGARGPRSRASGLAPGRSAVHGGLGGGLSTTQNRSRQSAEPWRRASTGSTRLRSTASGIPRRSLAAH